MPRAGSLPYELADGIDEESREAADKGAVDADELKIAADLQLDAARRFVGAHYDLASS